MLSMLQLIAVVISLLISPRGTLTVLFLFRLATPFHTLLVWLSPQTGVLTWMLETGIAEEFPALFMAFAMWVYPDALGTIFHHFFRQLPRSMQDALQEAFHVIRPCPRRITKEKPSVQSWNSVVAKLRSYSHGQEYQILKSLFHGDMCMSLNHSQLNSLEQRLLKAQQILLDHLANNGLQSS